MIPVDPQGPSAPSLAFAFRITAKLSRPIEQGTYEGLRRRIVPITAGLVEGPRFSGKVLEAGADWQSIRVRDGVTRLFARYALQHDDGTVVSVTNAGVRRGPQEVMDRLAAGERVDPWTYYFRATPQFEVEPGPHGWLAESVFVCVGKRWPDAVELDIYETL